MDLDNFPQVIIKVNHYDLKQIYKITCWGLFGTHTKRRWMYSDLWKFSKFLLLFFQSFKYMKLTPSFSHIYPSCIFTTLTFGSKWSNLGKKTKRQIKEEEQNVSPRIQKGSWRGRRWEQPKRVSRCWGLALYFFVCLFWKNYNIDNKSFYEQKFPLKIDYIWNECKAASQEGTGDEN